MNRAERAGLEIRAIEDMAAADSPVHRMGPLPKLLLTIAYIAVAVSFGKYDITGLFVLILFPIAGYMISMTSVKSAFYKMRFVLPLICVVGIINPFLDRELAAKVGNVAISKGVISMITLMLKGVFSLLASFLLIATTRIEDICAALRRIHFPKMLTSLILLTYRYILVLLDEVGIMTDAYHLRAPGQRGIHISAWGSFLGQLILRSMDRSSELYDSMILRGFTGDFQYASGRKSVGYSWPAALLIIALIVLARFFNIAVLFGGIVTR